MNRSLITSNSIEQEIDEKMRIISDIKRLQNQILVSDKVSIFLKKFDRQRKAPATPITIVSI